MLKKRMMLVLVLIMLIQGCFRSPRYEEVVQVIGEHISDRFDPPTIPEQPLEKKVRVETAYHEIILKQKYHIDNYDFLSDCKDLDTIDVGSSNLASCDKFDVLVSTNPRLLAIGFDQYLFKSLLLSKEMCDSNVGDVNVLIDELEADYNEVLLLLPTSSDTKLIRSFALFKHGNGINMARSAIDHYSDSPSQAMELACQDHYAQFSDCSSPTECCDEHGDHKRGSKYVKDVFDVYRDFCVETGGYFLTGYNI